jgi:hypothetical protein
MIQEEIISIVVPLIIGFLIAAALYFTVNKR